MTSRNMLALSIMAFSSLSLADPFDDCPKTAYLVQGGQAKVYGVDLATGYFKVLKDKVETNNKVNGMGFNVADNHLYGWDYKNNTLARINNEFGISSLKIINNIKSNFFVGDVALAENKYYMYRRGSAFGLYEIDLSGIEGLSDEELVDSGFTINKSVDGAGLTMKKVASGDGDMSLVIFDIAFHPTNGKAYSVNRNGKLIEITINADSATAKSFDGVAESGTYGAVYFDNAGNLYISRNQDGKIFKIDINTAEGTRKAEFFAQGPKSSTNDGARCAQESVDPAPEKLYDFGDAPNVYHTFLQPNPDDETVVGAHHRVVDDGIILGDKVDTEVDAYVYPLSDDATGELPEGDKQNDDDDGVKFITTLVPGETGIIEVSTNNTNGFLSAWFDWNQDGDFLDEKEALFTSPLSLEDTVTYLPVEVPADAKLSTTSSPETWARFRVATNADQITSPAGMAESGEVEDYPVIVNKADVNEVRFYPSKNHFSTLVYEDNWPLQGDYDLNDLVVYYRSETSLTNKKVTQWKFEGEIVAVGASFHSGFAVRLEGVSKDNVQSAKLLLNDADQSMYNGDLAEQEGIELLEAGVKDASFVISDDILEIITWDDADCSFYRTEKSKDNCDLPITFTYTLNVEFKAPIDQDNFPQAPYDPFIFATPDTRRNPFVLNPTTNNYEEDVIFAENPGRGLEIHLKDKSPTELFNSENTLVRGSVTNDNNPFATQNGMPWAMEFNTEWAYPSEFNDVIFVYFEFKRFILSGGKEFSDWFVLRDSSDADERFENANADKLYAY